MAVMTPNVDKSNSVVSDDTVATVFATAVLTFFVTMSLTVVATLISIWSDYHLIKIVATGLLISMVCLIVAIVCMLARPS